MSFPHDDPFGNSEDADQSEDPNQELYDWIADESLKIKESLSIMDEVNNIFTLISEELNKQKNS